MYDITGGDPELAVQGRLVRRRANAIDHGAREIGARDIGLAEVR